MNPLINKPSKPNYKNLYAEFTKNPREKLKTMFNIPDTVGDTPQEIGRYLFDSKQVSPQMANIVAKMMPAFSGWLGGK